MGQIHQFTVNGSGQRRLGKARSDVAGNIKYGYTVSKFTFAAVGESYLRHDFRLSGDHYERPREKICVLQRCTQLTVFG